MPTAALWFEIVANRGAARSVYRWEVAHGAAARNETNATKEQVYDELKTHHQVGVRTRRSPSCHDGAAEHACVSARQAGGHTSSSARITTHKGFLTTHKGFRIAKETPGQLHSPIRGSDRPGSGGGTDGGFKIPGNHPGDKPRVDAGPFHPGPAHTQAPIPPITGPVGPLNPGKFPGTGPNVPDYPGGSKPPILSGTPTKAPIPPITGPVGPLNPGNKPPILSGTPTQAPIPPITGPVGPLNPGNKPPILTGTPTRAPIPPITGPVNPGNYPSTPPISTAPAPTLPPEPVPVPGTTYTHRYGQVGVYADVSAGGYAPCQWFKDNYDRTGSAYWLNRYKVCLWQH